jgi:hypothetical protein
MAGRKALAIELSSEHERELTALTRAHSTPQKLADRARIIPHAAKGLGLRKRLVSWGYGARRPAPGEAVGGTRPRPPTWRHV